MQLKTENTNLKSVEELPKEIYVTNQIIDKKVVYWGGSEHTLFSNMRCLDGYVF